MSGIDDADLPLYISELEPSSASHIAVVDLVRRACAVVAEPPDPVPVLGGPPPAPVTGRPSPCFHRLIPVPGADLAAIVAAWWRHDAVSGRASLGRELLVTEPRVDTGTFTLVGRLRRGIGRRTLPVSIDLWAHSPHFTRVTLVPRAPVLATRHYFRVGHRALDALERELAAAARLTAML